MPEDQSPELEALRARVTSLEEELAASQGASAEELQRLSEEKAVFQQRTCCEPRVVSSESSGRVSAATLAHTLVPSTHSPNLSLAFSLAVVRSPEVATLDAELQEMRAAATALMMEGLGEETPMEMATRHSQDLTRMKQALAKAEAEAAAKMDVMNAEVYAWLSPTAGSWRVLLRTAR